MSWILGIDTASTQLDIGLFKDGLPACSYRRYLPGSHAEHISAAVKFILRAGGISAQDISHAGVVIGPGSFTGLRIGIAFIKGFFLLRDVRIMPVSSLEALACSWSGNESTVAVALEARKGNVFAARFRRDNGALKRIAEDARMPVEQFRDEIAESDAVLIDTLGYRKSSIFKQLSGISKLYLVEWQPVARGLAAARIAWENREQAKPWLSAIELLPRYLQKSAAEIRQKRARAVE